MLVGRDTESARLDDLVAGIRSGGSETLVVRGEPGVGKTALIERLRHQGEGIRLLTASGFEAERELPYAGLSMLVAPIAGSIDALPAAQRAPLAAALGRGPPAAQDRFAAYAGVLGLLALAAESGPELVLVDDAHWLDRASGEALVFAARRLGREGIGMVFTARDDDRPGFAAAGLPELRLGGLNAGATAELIRRRSGTEVAGGVATTLCTATAGNPLALVELADLLTAAQLCGSEALDEPLPAGKDIQRAFGDRIGALPEQTRRALVVAAADAGVAYATLAHALRVAGIESEALTAAEAAELVKIDSDGARFRHPLWRSAAYQQAPAPERRAAHRALACALDGDANIGRRAWHRAAATLEADEAVAAELEEVSRDALKRGAPSAAGRALESAAQLTSEPGARTRRLIEAAQSFGLAAECDSARPLLEAALGEAGSDPLLRADIQQLRVRLHTADGSLRAMHDLLVAEADLVGPADETRSASLLADASSLAVMDCAPEDAMAAARRALSSCASLGDQPAAAAEYSLGAALLLAGRTDEARPRFEHAWKRLEHDEELVLMAASLALEQQCFEEFELGRDMLRGVLGRAQRAGNIAALPYILAASSWIELRLGDWTAAYSLAARAHELAEATHHGIDLAFSLVRMAHVEAARGWERDAREHAERALAIANATGLGTMAQFSAHALGFLELGLGRLRDAVETLEPIGEWLVNRGFQEPMALPWTQDLTEAYIGLGDSEAATRTLQTLEQQAGITGQRLAGAATMRYRGLLAAEEAEARDLFDCALLLHDARPAPFERARTELCFGERLRRGRRRTEAREHLHRALDAFEGLGAAPWSDKARRELAATGATARRRRPDTRDDLTPQELQVAMTVAEGATNREAAAQLFVSPKTVETHLSHIYRKLGVRSRTELARRLRAEPASRPVSAPRSGASRTGAEPPVRSTHA